MSVLLTVYTLEQADQWDSIVRTFPQHDTYYLSGYVKAFQLHGDGEPLLFHYEKEDTRGICVVMKRDIAHCSFFKDRLEEEQFFDLSCPYGYGGWLTEGKDIDGLITAYESWCRKNGIVSEFVRFHPVLENHHPMAGHYDIIPLGETVTMDLSSPEIIWANISSKNRNMIRKAQKNGIVIYRGHYPEIYRVFREIYNGTMDKDNASSYYYFSPEFYESVLNDLPHNAQVFYAVLEDRIIAASIMLSCNGRMNYHLSGSLREYAHLAPTNLLLFQAALWGCANGCRSLYLGGGVGSGEDGLFKFKRSFYRGDDLHRFYIGKKIFNQEKYDELVALRESIPEGGFFPRYRA